MGERGPLAIPYARRRNKRRTSGKSVLIARPPMPRDLSDEAKAEWRRVVPELEDMGVLATIDRALLIRYCTAWADWCELQSLLKQSGKLLKGRQGTLVRNPLWFMKQDAEQNVTELGRQLALSPAARLRAGIAHVNPPDPEEEKRRVAAMDRYRRMFESQSKGES